MRDRIVGRDRICADRGGWIYPQGSNSRGCDLYDSSRSRRKNRTSRPDDRVALLSSCGRALKRLFRMTEREKEIIALIAGGLSNQQIAGTLEEEHLQSNVTSITS